MLKDPLNPMWAKHCRISVGSAFNRNIIGWASCLWAMCLHTKAPERRKKKKIKPVFAPAAHTLSVLDSITTQFNGSTETHHKLNHFKCQRLISLSLSLSLLHHSYSEMMTHVASVQNLQKQ